MIRFLLALLILISASQAVDTLSIPTDFNTVTTGTRANLSGNFTAVQTWGNKVRDTVAQVTSRISGYSGTMLISSLSNLRLKLDADNSETARLLVEAGNGDSLFRVSEDTTARFFRHLKIDSNLTVGGTILAPTLSSPTVTGTLAGANGTFSGTLGVTGEQTASGGILFATGGGGQGRIYRSAVDGLIARAVAGSSNDFALISAAGNILLSNPAGTGNLTVGYASGGVTVPGTLGVTGQLTASGGIDVSGGTSAAGRLTTNATNGLVIRGRTGSSYDMVLTSPGGSDLMYNPTGTSSIQFPGTGITIAGTEGVTGKLTGSDTVAALLGFRAGNTAASNVNLYRASADMWKTDDSLTVAGKMVADTLVSPKFYNDTGSFTITLRGCSADPNGTAKYLRIGKKVTLTIPYLTCTSDSQGAAMTGLPTQIQPPNDQYIMRSFRENNTVVNPETNNAGFVVSGSAVRFYLAGYTALFAASSTRANQPWSTPGLATILEYTLQ